MDADDYLNTFLDALLDYLARESEPALRVHLIAAIKHARWVADSTRDSGWQ